MTGHYNAYKFIKQNGLDKAREIVEGAPDNCTHIHVSELILSDDPCVAYTVERNGRFHEIFKKYTRTFPINTKEKFIGISELRQAIADYELVKRYKNIPSAKRWLERNKGLAKLEETDDLENAIKRIESGEEV